jgi:phosphoribosyl 1,2-cyclic phosphate phosphodiesterase
MKVTILGSAAAEAVPAVWCECDICRRAKQNGGRDIRRRTAYLIDDDTLVDFGPDAFHQAMLFDIEWSKIRRLLITHAHEDHLNPVELLWRQPGFSQVGSSIKIFGSQKVFERITSETRCSFEALKLNAVEVRPGDNVTDDNLDFLALKANHGDNDGQSLNFILSRQGKTILIANDTGWWEEETWRAVGRIRLDAAIIEATMGISPRFIGFRDGHLSADSAVAFRDRLLELGAITATTPVIVNHFSHNGWTIHDDLCAFFNPHRIEVGYDGLKLEL